MILGLVLIIFGGFLVGGVISTWSKNRWAAVVIAVLAVLAVAAGLLRVV